MRLILIQGHKRNIFQRGQSHFPDFFPSVKCFFPVENSHFGRPTRNFIGVLKLFLLPFSIFHLPLFDFPSFLVHFHFVLASLSPVGQQKFPCLTEWAVISCPISKLDKVSVWCDLKWYLTLSTTAEVCLPQGPRLTGCGKLRKPLSVAAAEWPLPIALIPFQVSVLWNQEKKKKDIRFFFFFFFFHQWHWTHYFKNYSCFQNSTVQKTSAFYLPVPVRTNFSVFPYLSLN